jgi:DNA polymerase III epsilon subunit-like protein
LIRSIAVVDIDENVVLRLSVKPSLPITSYLTPITGIKAEDIADSVTIEAAEDQVHALFGSDVLLVGQAIQSDVAWLRLVKGVHYRELHDLADTFKAFNAKYKRTCHFSLQHEANTLLGTNMSGAHDPAQDAQVSIRLYKKYVLNGSKGLLDEARARLRKTKVAPSVVKEIGYKIDGVCMAKFNINFCSCGQPGI